MQGLFAPFKLQSVTLKNRIAVSPMCQYSADDGVVTQWHRAHYPALARGGAGLVIVEATAVSPEGRITYGDTGLWNDDQKKELIQIVKDIKAAGAVPGIQLGHAGRKACARRPWEGDDHLSEDDPLSWPIIGPSAVAHGDNLPRVPRAMSLEDIQRVQHDFVMAALRAKEAGFEWLVLHFAHGYLAQSFLSIHANQRQDAYGGEAENRGRFMLETLRAVRKVWPRDLPLTARVGVIEYDGRDEETLKEAIKLLKKMKEEGLDLVDCSMGFSTPDARIPWGANFMVPTASKVRQETGLPSATSWFISDPVTADTFIREGSLDLVMLARPMLANPHWPFMAAKTLKIDDPAWVMPAPYAHWLSRYRTD